MQATGPTIDGSFAFYKNGMRGNTKPRMPFLFQVQK